MTTTNRLTNAVFEGAKGGFWIKPEGGLLPVRKACGHSETLMEYRGIGYTIAYELGYIRLSFFGSSTVDVTLGNAATTEALTTLAELMRLSDFPALNIDVENEDIKYDYNSTFPRGGRMKQFSGDKAPQRAASWAMRQALIRNIGAAPHVPVPALEMA